MKRAITAFSLLLAFGVSVRADVPQQINHQGVVSVNGTPFNGAGLFRFAIVKKDNPDLGLNLWTNDGTNLTVGGVPTAAVSMSVANGVYTVRLGDPGLANMTPVPPLVFNTPNTALRIWFDDGINGNQQLTPDHPLVSSPYSLQTAIQPPIGSIIAWHKNLPGVPALPDGWIECTNPTGTATISVTESPLNGQLIPELNNTPPGYNAGGRFLRGSTHSGDLQDGSLHFSEMNNPTGNCVPRDDGAWVHYSDEPEGSNLVDGYQYNCSDISGFLSDQRLYEYARPVNMSVVWIMRVK